ERQTLARIFPLIERRSHTWASLVRFTWKPTPTGMSNKKATAAPREAAKSAIPSQDVASTPKGCRGLRLYPVLEKPACFMDQSRPVSIGDLGPRPPASAAVAKTRGCRGQSG